MQTEVNLADFGRALKSLTPALTDAPDGDQVVELRASKKALRIWATGRTLTIGQRIAADVSERGTVVVPAKLLGDITSKGLADVVNLAVNDDGDLTFGCGELSATIRHRPGDAPQKIRVASEFESAQLTSSEWARVARLRFACSAKLDRPLLTGVHMSPGHAAATDSFRIARTQLTDWDLDVLLPAAVFSLVAEAGESVKIRFDGNVLAFRTSTASWVCPVMPDGYPPLDQFFAENANTQMTCDRSALVHAVSAAGVFPGTVVELSGGDSGIVVRAESSQLGSIAIDLHGSMPPGRTVTFAAGLLHDALSAAVDDTLTVLFTERSAIIRCSSFEQLVLMRR